jgi:hypothetical protein
MNRRIRKEEAKKQLNVPEAEAEREQPVGFAKEVALPEFAFSSEVKHRIRRLVVTAEKPFKEALYELLGLPMHTYMNRVVFTKAYNMWFEYSKRSKVKKVPIKEDVELVARPEQAVQERADVHEDLRQ